MARCNFRSEPEGDSLFAGRYVMEYPLGSGGMATVYRANDRKHGRAVAIKLLSPELSVTLAAQRFLREIRITAKLQHPHIVTLIDSGDADGLLFFVMPLVEGESLRRRLQYGPPFGLPEAIDLTCQLASALDYAHAQGVVHRDVKPENVLLQSRHAFLMDFGVAVAVDSALEEGLTKSGASVGTPQYMSPEQARGQRVLDPRTDIYSLGCVLYEMLAGAPPFAGSRPRVVMARHIAERPPSLRVVRRDVSRRLERAVEQALAKSPDDRFQTVTSFAEALRTA